MEYLYNFLRHATLIDLILVAFAIIVAVSLVLAGIWVAFYAKSRLIVGIYAGFAFVPLLLCLLGILAQWLHNQASYPSMENPEMYYANDRADYLVAGVIGIFLTALPVLIGMFGLLKPRPRT